MSRVACERRSLGSALVHGAGGRKLAIHDDKISLGAVVHIDTKNQVTESVQTRLMRLPGRLVIRPSGACVSPIFQALLSLRYS